MLIESTEIGRLEISPSTHIGDAGSFERSLPFPVIDHRPWLEIAGKRSIHRDSTRRPAHEIIGQPM
ncbi:MAG: hypothetical protein HY852_21010 [Bradyrhizobium sp.]|uniref:hypothetical protein n=1 Tax=Bradyrhizobium sp. TaxID=376 RepID=UPI0025BDC473|nr:hypothetical protein [Bradyrhizobium sp.]MBI5264290.1 hypothetical protein [Bradyrhizobium sp.]